MTATVLHTHQYFGLKLRICEYIFFFTSIRSGQLTYWSKAVGVVVGRDNDGGRILSSTRKYTLKAH
jgi:hypothetical protein